jgi:zinc transport system substrate-binding protein
MPTLRMPLLGLALLTALACGDDRAPDQSVAGTEHDRILVVYTVNYPLQFFAERIGGDRVRAIFPAPADTDPAFWSPGPEAVAGFQEADLILLNGAGYAKWVERVTLPTARLVDTSAAVRGRFIEIPSAATHSHGPQGEHSHGEIAFTTWLDPRLAAEQARAVYAAMAAARPADDPTFRKGLEALEHDLLELDRDQAQTAGDGGGPALLASHPVYQYLAQRYGIDMVSVHFEPDEVPGEADWRALEKLVEARPARWMLWEGEPLDETKRRLGALGIESVVYSPCGNVPEHGDFLTAMRANAERLARILGASS